MPRLVEALLRRGWTIAVAESLTGGEVNARLCACPGSGDVALGGIVSYSTEAKRSVLGVRAQKVVSASAAAEMAKGVRSLFGADVGLSSTGVAGPDRQDDEPIGTLFVGYITPEDSGTCRFGCVGTPDQIKRDGTAAALELLLGRIETQS
jgi:nicotinamide-nucleotide amidase